MLMNMLSDLSRLDNVITQKIKLNDERSPLFKLGALLAHSGDSWLWLVGLATSWLLTEGNWHADLTFIILALIFQALVVLILKLLFRRSRPQGSWGDIYRVTDPHSFPSGHAARAVLLAVLSWHLLSGWAAVFLSLWAFLVCLARVAMGVHYFSDIVAGAAVGLIAGWGVIAMKPWLVSALPFLFFASPKLIFSLYNK
jgi:membrane-associated phospholipid phosphatase